jgi:arabinose-5-phosphate isomerase
MSSGVVEQLRETETVRHDAELLALARNVVRIESEGVASLIERLDERFIEAVRLILGATGRVVVTGVGKSGLVARKIASTLASTGTPALFLHPVEGAHGDVGVLLRGDVLVIVSRSGTSEELIALLPSVRRLEIPIVAITGVSQSPLGRAAKAVLDVGVSEEACPHDLTPTSSSTAALVMGDAVAMALLHSRGFEAEDFARLHPGGVLGRRLLWRVEDVMLSGDEVPVVGPDVPLAEAMHEIAHRRGTVPVVDADRRVVGVMTAGDLTRFAEEHADFLTRPAAEAMNADPKVVGPTALAMEALGRMEEHGVMAMPVVDATHRLVGIVHLHDVLRAGVR